MLVKIKSASTTVKVCVLTLNHSGKPKTNSTVRKVQARVSPSRLTLRDDSYHMPLGDKLSMRELSDAKGVFRTHLSQKLACSIYVPAWFLSFSEHLIGGKCP
jgi:hypothetical protein